MGELAAGKLARASHCLDLLGPTGTGKLARAIRCLLPIWPAYQWPVCQLPDSAELRTMLGTIMPACGPGRKGGPRHTSFHRPAADPQSDESATASLSNR
jgi:hypothetical protein